MSVRSLSVALLVLLASAPPALAQVQLGAGLGVGVLVGSDFEGNEGGAALQLDALIGPSSGLQFGGTFQWTSLGLEGSSDSQSALELLGTVRYLFKPDLAQLYVAARGGWMRKRFDPTDLTWTGFSIGPGVGLILPFPGVGLEIALDSRYVSLGLPDGAGAGLGEIATRSSSGLQLTSRIGVSVPVGR